MNYVGRFYFSLEKIISDILKKFSQDIFSVPALNVLGNEYRTQRKEFDIKELFDGFLNAVPTKRVSIYRRRSIKMGAENWHWKMYKPKYNLVTCRTCGHHHEADCLCGNCYEKIKAETEAIQKAMVEELGLKPVEREVVVVYENEKERVAAEELQSKIIVEMKKPRPQWFSRNLLQRSHGAGSDVTIPVKPTDLG
ncbi:hypothetical protein QYM36_002681 [Artemia franciscana]|uniref:Large ribosomal subunit protein bL32m n=2 Tax=Artemia franciscana TaxID=6661 RepID=A0AA88L8B8_ARTSF|nr:hypothetical protein QYM36_002681 [Artemia franciscana]